jgi:hypothetical protein
MATSLASPSIHHQLARCKMLPPSVYECGTACQNIGAAKGSRIAVLTGYDGKWVLLDACAHNEVLKPKSSAYSLREAREGLSWMP